MSKKISICLLSVFIFIANVYCYDIATEENPNYTYNDIVYAFYNQYITQANSSRYYVIYDSVVYHDKDRNFYWTASVDKKENYTNIVLWVDNGYIRITCYPKYTKFSDGCTWDLKDPLSRLEFQNRFVQSLTSFFSSCQLEKKKYGKTFKKEEADAMLYCTNLFFGR